ncbi:2-hydroxychromene-2-carboxylate isomerase [Azoarcus olearius]|uniref:2-hydroxychromene-2-carboxylate isomerase n=1 Tax=Azoarcus sp. (strain BH72) TaxID=418699 RepID=A1K2F7_AZOSB|nr:2-hydroxychromene-2-carboxylate isomerase [Azoarcus olearius]CAL93012.1 2-hydroxychromene-2-carboxylate isomerase family protein [Azoarcus olearius]
MTPPKTIDFWFDFSSPYGYFMSEKIDAVARRHGRDVRWRPFLLGVVYKEIGSRPLTEVPLKGEYTRRDLLRTARFLDLPFALPSPFPVATQHAARCFYWLQADDEALARRFAHAAYRAYFVEGRDISQQVEVVSIAAALEVDGAALSAALGDAPVKERLRAASAEAIAAGVFGSPYVIIDGEPFWGVDRLPQIEAWLAERSAAGR